MRNKYREIDDLNRVWRSQISSWDQLLAEPFSPNYKFASADLLAFSQKFSERYFKVCRDVIRKCAPERLYLGCRFAQNNRVASAAAAKFCDVVSVNLYHRPDEIGNYHLPGKKRNEVPLMVTEFHFGAKDRSFSSGLRGAESLEDRSKMVVEYIKSCVDHPGMIGSHWFQMYDQPLTGRVQDGENYQVGLLDVADTPYERMVRDLRELQFYWENNFMKD
jgi:hypothetical protein